MKQLTIAILLLVVLCAVVQAQESGNSAYGTKTPRPSTSTSGQLAGIDRKDETPSYFLDANVLLNVKADAYVVLFGLAQESATLQETSKKLDEQIKRFRSALDRLGIPASDTFVDFITQTKVYDYSVRGATAREKQSGFQLKKNISVRYTDRALLDRIVTAATDAEIFDLILVDYVVSDQRAVRARLFDEAQKVIKLKEANYAGLGVKLRIEGVAIEHFDTYEPKDLYRAYTAFETSSVDGEFRVVEKRKSSTVYFDPVNSGDFDSIITPIGIEPMVQCRLYLRVKYALAQ